MEAKEEAKEEVKEDVKEEVKEKAKEDTKEEVKEEVKEETKEEKVTVATTGEEKKKPEEDLANLAKLSDENTQDDEESAESQTKKSPTRTTDLVDDKVVAGVEESQIGHGSEHLQKSEESDKLGKVEESEKGDQSQEVDAKPVDAIADVEAPVKQEEQHQDKQEQQQEQDQKEQHQDKQEQQQEDEQQQEQDQKEPEPEQDQHQKQEELEQPPPAPESNSTTVLVAPDGHCDAPDRPGDDTLQDLEDNKPLRRGRKRTPSKLPNGDESGNSRSSSSPPKKKGVEPVTRCSRSSRSSTTRDKNQEASKAASVQNPDLPKATAAATEVEKEEEEDKSDGGAQSSQAIKVEEEQEKDLVAANNANSNGSSLAVPPLGDKVKGGERRRTDPYNFSEEEFSAPPPSKSFANGPLKRESSGEGGRKSKVAKKAKLRSQGSSELEEEFDDDHLELTEDEEDEEEDEEEEERKPRFSSSHDESCGGDDDDRLVIAEEELHDRKKPANSGHAGSGSSALPGAKPRRKHNRFNGMSEEEVAKRLLPDLIAPELDILIIGINPGMYAAYKGHHYAGPGNHFWKCMFLSGLVPHPMSADDDYKLLDFGIGFTNIVERTTKGSANLSRKEIVGGTQSLLEKIKAFRPKIAVFNGKGIYEVFSGKKDFHFGKQPDVIEGTGTHVWVMPNSSARCAQLPRAVDKVPFYEALKKYRDYLTGSVKDLDDSEVVFTNVKLKNFNEISPQKKLAAAAAAAAAVAASISGDSSDSMNSEFKVMSGGTGSGGDGSYTDGMDHIRVDPITGKKRRGRPPKPRPDGTMPPPKRRAVDAEGNPMPRGSNPIDPLTGKKKRGRPKKCDLPPGSVPPPPAPKKPKKTKAEKMEMEATSLLAAQLSSCGGDLGVGGGLGGLHGIPSVSNKPTKVVPPLPPFSPHFGRGDLGKMDLDDEKPVNLKSHSKVYNDDPMQQQQQHHHHHHRGHGYGAGSHDGSSRLHQEPCDYSDQQQQQPQPEDYSNNSNVGGGNGGGYHYPSHHSTQQQMKSDPQSNYSSSNSTPPHSYPNYSGGNGGGGGHSNSKASDDVTTKSITGLESLVDQIPALAENDSGVFSGSGAGSHPNTPRSVGPYSPAPSAAAAAVAQFQSSFHAPLPSSSSHGGNAFGTPPYASSASEDYPTVSVSSNCTPTDFSVNSLVHSSSASAYRSISPAGGGDGPSSSDPFSVSSLTSAEAMAAASKYGQQLAAGGNPYGMFHGSSFGAGGFLSGPNSFPAGHPMSSMGAMGHMGAMAGMSYYGQYPNGPYGGAGAPGFAPSPYSHGLHMPNPSYPYPSPYGQSPYSQSPYF